MPRDDSGKHSGCTELPAHPVRQRSWGLAHHEPHLLAAASSPGPCQPSQWLPKTAAPLRRGRRGLGTHHPGSGTETPDRAWDHPEKCHYGDSSDTAPLRTHESRSSSCIPAGLLGIKPGPGQGTYSCYGGFLPISCRRVSDIGPEEDHRLLKDRRAGGREEKAAVSLSGPSQGDAQPNGGEQITERTSPDLRALAWAHQQLITRRDRLQTPISNSYFMQLPTGPPLPQVKPGRQHHKGPGKQAPKMQEAAAVRTAGEAQGCC